MSASKVRSLVVAALFVVVVPVFAAPGALTLVPTDAVSVGVVKFSELRTSPLSSMLFKETDKFGSHGDADEFLREAGLNPFKDVDLLVVATAPRTALGSEAEVLVVAEGRFNTARLTKALTDRGALRKTTDHGAYLTFPEARMHRDETGAVAFPSSNMAIMGSESAVVEALATRAAGGSSFAGASGLGRDAGRVDSNASAWAVIDVARASRLAGVSGVPGHGPQGQALNAAIKSVSTVALWATDTGEALQLSALGLANDEETLELLEDTLRGALSAMRLAVREKAPDMVNVLRRFDVDRTRDSVRITGTIPAESLRKMMAQKRAAK